MLLGPGVNIYRTPLNGRNFEYMGEDPYLASRMVVPYIKGVQTNGVAAVIKHFALNNQEVARGYIDVQLSDRALHEIYLPAFKAGVMEAGVWALMGAYNKFRGQYCSHHNLLINKILKNEWAFDGVVVTDWGSAHDTKEAALYGLDLEMGTYTDGFTSNLHNAYDAYFMANPYLEMIRKGEVSVATLDEKVRRILRLMFRTSMNRNRPYGSLASPEHAAVARRIAEEGIVLLKNANHFFPVIPTRYKKIAVVGENAVRPLTQGGGSSELKPKHEISPLEGLTGIYGDRIVHTLGYASGEPAYGRENPSPYDADSLKRAAIALAKDADIVLFFGGLNKNHKQDCEGDDRVSFDLPFNQNELINELLNENSQTAVILTSGNSVAMPWIDRTPALLQSWYLGSEAGNALARIISGKVNPSGKLPFSIPKKLTDNAAHFYGTTSYPGDNIKVVYQEDILVGYRWHETKKIPPQFPFGYGLSYTWFEYGKAVSDKTTYTEDETIIVSLSITNKGNFDGAETVQLYASQDKPSVLRPARELKAFKKVYLKAGETQQVSLPVVAKDLAFFDEKRDAWILSPDNYFLYCAASSTDIKTKIAITIK
jgi:beta-glucosidase